MPFSPQTICDVTIDVSHHQGNIDWGRVGAAGKRVAMIKATQGSHGIDPMWKTNAASAREAGILVIPYVFLTPDDAASQATLLENVAQLASGLPAAIDWEGQPHSTATPQQVETIGLAIRDLTRRDPLGYWGLFPPGTPTAVMKRWPRWIPRYGVNNGSPDHHHEPTEPWLFWQYTSQGKVDGIAGPIDASLFAGSEAELKARCQTGALPAALTAAII
jgi:lysozyme